jgi:hypothetical protein
MESNLSASGSGGGLDMFDYGRCTSPEETSYRRWCLMHRLFLNPLNDLGPYPVGASDVLVVPPVVLGRGRGDCYHGFFNQIKQAYVSARFLHYEGLHCPGPHFSDRDVLLFDTKDYPSYSLAVEKLKAAYAMAYSQFDRIARFLNHYMGLGIPDEQVTFGTFWYEQGRPERGLRPEFRERRNWPLRGLFWLSRDLYEDGTGPVRGIEPEAMELADIRGQLERGYLKLHEDFYEAMSCDTGAPPPGLYADRLAYSLRRGDFESKALRVLRMVRSAVMYLSFAIHVELKLRRPGAGPPGRCRAMTLAIMD